MKVSPRAVLLHAALLVGLPTLATTAFLALPWQPVEKNASDWGGVRLTDRTGRLLGRVPAADGAQVELLSADEIPGVCREIFVRLEDERFFMHPGVDPAALLRASVFGLKARLAGRGDAGGGSTITMQLARICSPHARTVRGKLGEALAALRIEAHLGKKEILTLYLNSLPFGRNVRGIGDAARAYFHSDLSGLDAAELLALAVIPRNPKRYEPRVSPRALIEEAWSISQAKNMGIPRDAIENAVMMAGAFAPAAGEASRRTDGRIAGGAASDRAHPGRAGPAPHFARYLLAHTAREGARPPEGRLVTTLDLDLTEYLQGRIRHYLDAYRFARVTNAACLVIENRTGAVRAWVGSRDFSDDETSGQVDGVLIRRQSASTLKPFLYGLALSTGWTAATLLPDVPMEFGGEESYRPVNFDRKNRGTVRLRSALAGSLNVPAVFTLSRIGEAEFLSHLGQLGFAVPADAKSRYGLGAAIGNAEVSLLELTRAFSVFPRGGTLPRIALFQSDARRHEAAEGTRIYDSRVAWLIADILSDPSSRTTGFGTRTYFRTPFPAMFKSGTSSEFTNLWCVGATPDYTVGVWAGNFDGRAVINKTGSIIPAQIAVDALTRVTRQAREFTRPEGISRVDICTLTGERATPSCPSTRVEYFSAPVPPLPDCSVHRGGGTLYETGRVPLDVPAGIRILYPVNGELFYFDETMNGIVQRIPVLVSAPRGAELEASLDGGPFILLPERSTVPATRGRHSLVVRAGNLSQSVSFTVN